MPENFNLNASNDGSSIMFLNMTAMPSQNGRMTIVINDSDQLQPNQMYEGIIEAQNSAGISLSNGSIHFSKLVMIIAVICHFYALTSVAGISQRNIFCMSAFNHKISQDLMLTTVVNSVVNSAFHSLKISIFSPG